MNPQDPTTPPTALAYCAFLDRLEEQQPGPHCSFEHVLHAAFGLCSDDPACAAALTAGLLWREIQRAQAELHDGSSDSRAFWEN